MRKPGAVLMMSLAILAFVAGPSADAGGKKASVEPGKYKGWGPDIDEIEIVKSFRSADYNAIVVTKIDTSSTPLPDEKEKSFQSVKSVLDGFAETLTEALR